MNPRACQRGRWRKAVRVELTRERLPSPTGFEARPHHRVRLPSLLIYKGFSAESEALDNELLKIGRRPRKFSRVTVATSWLYEPARAPIRCLRRSGTQAGSFRVGSARGCLESSRACPWQGGRPACSQRWQRVHPYARRHGHCRGNEIPYIQTVLLSFGRPDNPHSWPNIRARRAAKAASISSLERPRPASTEARATSTLRCRKSS